MTIKQEIKILSVRLEIERENRERESIGSGVIWTPHENSVYTYIFTAAHVVDDYLHENVQFCVSYYDIHGKKASSMIDKDNIAIHNKYIKKDKAKGRNLNDVAVIRIKKLNCKKIAYDFVIPCEIKEGSGLIFSGFMKKLSNLEFEINRNDYVCSFDSMINEKEAFKYKLHIKNGLDVSMKNDELVGVSGSGVFSYGEENLSLVGIHTHGVGEDVTMNMLIGMSVNLILDICTVKGWDIPVISEYNPSSYISYIEELNKINKTSLENIAFVERRVRDIENRRDINIKDILYDKNHYIILSEPGGGKTSAIKSLCHNVTNNSHNKIPIILNLRGYELNFDNIIDGILKILLPYNEKLEIDEVNELINRGNLIIFLDGLDEIKQSSYIKCISEINNLLTYSSKSKYIITCRSNRYNKEFESISKELELKELNEQEIRQYLFRDSKNIYMEKLDSRVLKIIKNPLLMNIFYRIIKTNSSYKPKSRVDLYNEFLQTLIYKWNKKEGKSTISRFMKIELQNIFTQIAYKTFQMNDFEEEFLYDLIYGLCKDKSKVEEVFEYILNIGILESVNEIVWFKHKTYKEYFMARYIMKVMDDKYNFIKKIINDSDWMEVLVFIAGMFDDWEDQNTYLDIVLDNNFKLYIECVKEKNDLSKSLDNKSDEDICNIYLHTMYKTYKNIIDKYFSQIKDRLDPYKYYFNYEDMKLSIKGNLVEKKHLYYKYLLKDNDEGVIVEDIKSYNKKESYSTGETLYFINISLSNLDLDSARYTALKSIKKQLLDIIDKKGLFSFEIICERIEYEKRRIGIKEDKKIIEKVDKVLKECPDMKGYTYNGVDILNLYNYIKFLEYNSINIEENILPKGDIDINKRSYKIWDVYSKERLVDRISKFFEFYKKSIIYIVENSFFEVRELLPCYRNLPYRYTVKYYFRKAYLDGKTDTYLLGPGGLSYFYEPNDDNSYKPNLIECEEDKFKDDDIDVLNRKYENSDNIIGDISVTTTSISELLHDDSLSKFIHNKMKREIEYLFDGIK